MINKQEILKNKSLKIETDENEHKIYVRLSNSHKENIIFYRGNSIQRAEKCFNDIKQAIENNIL